VQKKKWTNNKLKQTRIAQFAHMDRVMRKEQYREGIHFIIIQHNHTHTEEYDEEGEGSGLFAVDVSPYYSLRALNIARIDPLSSALAY